MKAGLASTTNTNSTDKATRPLAAISLPCRASPLPSVAKRVIGSTGTEAVSMADSITIIGLQSLRTLTLSGVREAYSGLRVAATLGTQATWGETFDPEPTQRCSGPQIARFIRSTHFQSSAYSAVRDMTLAISIRVDPVHVSAKEHHSSQ